jgi:hypothetical protein
MSRTFALMWDCYGLEALEDCTEVLKQHTWAELAGRDRSRLPQPPNLQIWEFRARFNPQRNYEIYVLTTEDDVTADQLRQAFEDTPQKMADTVRALGQQIYSARDTSRERIIR